jgi:Spy/CpxP family protein refolding chaperone
MKNSLKFILMLTGLFMLAAPVIRAEEPAAPPSDKPDRPEHRGPGAMMERAAKELGLTADQEAKWKEIGQREKTALGAIRSDSTLSREDRRAKAMETNKTFADQRRAVLNADQQKKFDDMRAKMRERGPREPEGHDRQAPPPEQASGK